MLYTSEMVDWGNIPLRMSTYIYMYLLRRCCRRECCAGVPLTHDLGLLRTRDTTRAKKKTGIPLPATVNLKDLSRRS